MKDNKQKGTILSKAILLFLCQDLLLHHSYKYFEMEKTESSRWFRY